jgi:DNA polymerase-3 subunit beta
MKFKINRDHFNNGLAQVLNVVGSRSTMPILSNVLIEAVTDNEVSLTTTNLELGIRCKIKAEVMEPGKLTLPAKKLATIVRELPNSDVELTVKDLRSLISSGGSKFRLMGLNAEEFPPLPEFDDDKMYQIRKHELIQMLKSVSYAQSTDENRYMLNGVYFNFEENKFTVVATDGRRLALNGKKLEVPKESEGSLILPLKTVNELLRISGSDSSVKISFNQRQVAFDVQVTEEDSSTGLVGGIYMVSKVVEGQYPNYQQVIPSHVEHRIKIERELMMECIKRSALMVSDNNQSVTFKMANNLLEINGKSHEYGESHETMAIDYDGPEVRVSINPFFMMDPLKALSQDDVFFEFKDEFSPGVFRDMEEFICVVMPLRLE